MSGLTKHGQAVGEMLDKLGAEVVDAGAAYARGQTWQLALIQTTLLLSIAKSLNEIAERKEPA
jgi:adenine/guanine phosphoribosyltransferase-like PRPP-binding protein